MNFANLSKIVNFADGLDKLQNLITRALQNLSDFKFSEVALYHPPGSSPEEFYLLLFWYQLETLPEAKSHIWSSLIQSAMKVSLTELGTYKLIWEFRSVSTRSNASQLSVTNFPDTYPRSRLTQLVKLYREPLRETPGLVASWFGVNITGAVKLLVRLDFNSAEAELAYFNSPIFHALVNQAIAEGGELELSSLDLHGFLEKNEFKLLELD